MPPFAWGLVKTLAEIKKKKIKVIFRFMYACVCV